MASASRSLTGYFNDTLEGVNANELKDHIVATCAGTTVMEHQGDVFLVYDPDHDLPPERMQPFVTIVTGDHYDDVSQLDSHPDAYRVNIGLPKARYAELLGDVSPTDYATRDALLPHPTYARQHWLCVVSPAEATERTVLSLVMEAYEFAVRKHTNYRARTPNTNDPTTGAT